MKTILLGLILVVLVILISIPKDVMAATLPREHSTFWPVQVNVAEISVDTLPAFAKIKLKGGQSVSGYITVIDDESHQLSLQRNLESIFIPLSQVENIQKDEGIAMYPANSPIIYRSVENIEYLNSPVNYAIPKLLKGYQNSYTQETNENIVKSID